MAAPPTRQRPAVEIIDLVSDDDEDDHYGHADVSTRMVPLEAITLDDDASSDPGSERISQPCPAFKSNLVQELPVRRRTSPWRRHDARSTGRARYDHTTHTDADLTAFPLRPAPSDHNDIDELAEDPFVIQQGPPRRVQDQAVQEDANPFAIPGAYPVSAMPARGTYVEVDGEPIWIPDEEEDEPPARPQIADYSHRAIAADVNAAVMDLAAAEVVDADACLLRVLELFPDISHDYVHTLYNEFDRESNYEKLPGTARLENILEKLLADHSYPKQGRCKKRKRQQSLTKVDEPWERWQQPGRMSVPNFLKGSMKAMLKADFPEIPVQYINDTLAEHVHLFPAYIALAQAKDASEGSGRPYGRGRPSVKHAADADTIALGSGWPDLLEELNSARTRVQIIRSERAEDDRKRLAEQENLQKAIDSGATAECSACFDDLPMNRQIHCTGSQAHFTCFGCAETYVKCQVGESKCAVPCPAGCGAGFAVHQLNLLSDKQTLAKLGQLQQEKDIRDAGMDDLEECPFCDYKAVMPPVEENFEFRCANPECERTSCRRCKAISHIPVSCEQHAKDNKVNSRHIVEEAMTAALIRSCNKCKKQFIKDYGCNKMTCPSCGNKQCYVCSASVEGYDHFDQRSRPGQATGIKAAKPCPLQDNVEERHEREVKEAEAAARAQVVQENPDITAEDLEIKISDAVKSSTANGGHGAGREGGIDFFLDGLGLDEWPGYGYAAHAAARREANFARRARAPAPRPARAHARVPIYAGVPLNLENRPMDPWQNINADELPRPFEPAMQHARQLPRPDDEPFRRYLMGQNADPPIDDHHGYPAEQWLGFGMDGANYMDQADPFQALPMYHAQRAGHHGFQLGQPPANPFATPNVLTQPQIAQPMPQPQANPFATPNALAQPKVERPTRQPQANPFAPPNALVQPKVAQAMRQPQENPLTAANMRPCDLQLGMQRMQQTRAADATIIERQRMLNHLQQRMQQREQYLAALARATASD